MGMPAFMNIMVFLSFDQSSWTLGILKRVWDKFTSANLGLMIHKNCTTGGAPAWFAFHGWCRRHGTAAICGLLKKWRNYFAASSSLSSLRPPWLRERRHRKVLLAQNTITTVQDNNWLIKCTYFKIQLGAGIRMNVGLYNPKLNSFLG